MAAPSFADMGNAIGSLIMLGKGQREEEEDSVLLSEEHSLILTCCWVSVKVGASPHGTARVLSIHPHWGWRTEEHCTYLEATEAFASPGEQGERQKMQGLQLSISKSNCPPSLLLYSSAAFPALIIFSWAGAELALLTALQLCWAALTAACHSSLLTAPITASYLKPAQQRAGKRTFLPCRACSRLRKCYRGCVLKSILVVMG